MVTDSNLENCLANRSRLCLVECFYCCVFDCNHCVLPFVPCCFVCYHYTYTIVNCQCLSLVILGIISKQFYRTKCKKAPLIYRTVSYSHPPLALFTHTPPITPPHPCYPTVLPTPLPPIIPTGVIRSILFTFPIVPKAGGVQTQWAPSQDYVLPNPSASSTPLAIAF